MTVESIVLRLTLDFQAYQPQAFPNFHLMIFAIAGAHGGHALPIQRRHIASYTSSQDQARTNQERAKSHRRRSDEVPIHGSFLRNDVVSVSPPLAGCDSVCWYVLRGAVYAHSIKQALCHTSETLLYFFCRVPS